MHEDTAIKMCQALDSVEADLRMMERRLTNLRMQIREFVPQRKRNQCGFDEDTDAERLAPRPSVVGI